MKACNHAISTHSYKYCKMKVVNWAFCYLQCGDVWLVLLLHLSLSDRCFPRLGSGCHRLGLNELVLRLFTLSNKAELTKSSTLKFSILLKSKYYHYFAISHTSRVELPYNVPFQNYVLTDETVVVHFKTYDEHLNHTWLLSRIISETPDSSKS